MHAARDRRVALKAEEPVFEEAAEKGCRRKFDINSYGVKIERPFNE